MQSDTSSTPSALYCLLAATLADAADYRELRPELAECIVWTPRSNLRVTRLRGFVVTPAFTRLDTYASRHAILLVSKLVEFSLRAGRA